MQYSGNLCQSAPPARAVDQPISFLLRFFALSIAPSSSVTGTELVWESRVRPESRQPPQTREYPAHPTDHVLVQRRELAPPSQFGRGRGLARFPRRQRQDYDHPPRKEVRGRGGE
jgi:hypothetical protein